MSISTVNPRVDIEKKKIDVVQEALIEDVVLRENTTEIDSMIKKDPIMTAIAKTMTL